MANRILEKELRENKREKLKKALYYAGRMLYKLLDTFANEGHLCLYYFLVTKCN